MRTMRLLNIPLSLRTAQSYILVSFILLYLFLIEYCRTHYYRDPTSIFFDPDRGFTPTYSKFRVSQGNNYIHHVNTTLSSAQENDDVFASTKTNKNASLCVGISSIARHDIDYFDSAVGSLLVDLTDEERDDIHLILFIAHTDPTEHPYYKDQWLSESADQLLLYDLPETQINHLKSLEMGKDHDREKGLFDFIYLLKACQEVGSPYVVTIEDDVIAMDGWYHRTRQALGDVERQMQKIGASKYLYLRLFYTEKFLGWNGEEWFTYLVCSIAAIASVGATLIAIRYYMPRTERFLPNESIAVICFICAPLCIVLFFAAGRVSMLPISTGVHQMPNFGCCTQAMAFPHDRLTDVISWYESQQRGDADSLLEMYADEHDEIRWAITPSLFQHIGSKSSKFGNDGSRRIAQSIWNFQFELNEPISLQIDHERAANS